MRLSVWTICDAKARSSSCCSDAASVTKTCRGSSSSHSWRTCVRARRQQVAPGRVSAHVCKGDGLEEFARLAHNQRAADLEEGALFAEEAERENTRDRCERQMHKVRVSEGLVCKALQAHVEQGIEAKTEDT